MNSPSFQAAWRISRIGDVLTNYFWLHWIYLGLVLGVLSVVAISAWLRLLGTQSVLYSCATWLILGQASGSYVGPKTWSALLIEGAASILRVGTRQHGPAAMRSRPSALRAQLRFINPHPGYLQS